MPPARPVGTYGCDVAERRPASGTLTRRRRCRSRGVRGPARYSMRGWPTTPPRGILELFGRGGKTKARVEPLFHPDRQSPLEVQASRTGRSVAHLPSACAVGPDQSVSPRARAHARLPRAHARARSPPEGHSALRPRAAPTLDSPNVLCRRSCLSRRFDGRCVKQV